MYVLLANLHSCGKIYWYKIVGSLQRNGLPIYKCDILNLIDLNGKLYVFLFWVIYGDRSFSWSYIGER